MRKTVHHPGTGRSPQDTSSPRSSRPRTRSQATGITGSPLPSLPALAFPTFTPPPYLPGTSALPDRSLSSGLVSAHLSLGPSLPPPHLRGLFHGHRTAPAPSRPERVPERDAPPTTFVDYASTLPPPHLRGTGRTGPPSLLPAATPSSQWRTIPAPASDTLPSPTVLAAAANGRGKPRSDGTPLLAPDPPTLPALGKGKKARARKGSSALDQILDLAGALNLLGPLGIDFDGDPSSYSATLDRAAQRRGLTQANLPLLRSALPWLASFILATGRVFFKPAFGSEKEVGQVWNSTSLNMFKEFMRQSIPRGKTKRGFLSASSVNDYAGAIRILRSREARYDVAPVDTNMMGRLITKQMLREDGPSGSRTRNTGIRAEHLRLAAAGGFDRTSMLGLVRWAIAAVSLNMLLRGGEVGVPDNVEVDPLRIITWGSITWMEPCRESEWRLWALIRVVPIKDQTGRVEAFPTPVPRRHGGPIGSDPVDPYDALALAWWTRTNPGVPFPVDQDGVPIPGWEAGAPAPALDEAFFSHPGGEPYVTSQVRTLGKAIARAAGIPDKDVGGKCFRIGGATDWRETQGHAGAAVIKRRGRWDSDCTLIYQRDLIEEQLSAAAKAGLASGRDLEALCIDHMQRAGRH